MRFPIIAGGVFLAPNDMLIGDCWIAIDSRIEDVIGPVNSIMPVFTPSGQNGITIKCYVLPFVKYSMHQTLRCPMFYVYMHYC